MTGLRWYAHGTRVYARRGPHEHAADPIVIAAATPQLAQHVAALHNTALVLASTATRIVPTARTSH